MHRTIKCCKNATVRIMDKLSQVFCLLSGIKKMMVSKSKSSLTPQLWGLFYFEASLLSKTYNSLVLGSSESYFFSAPKGSKTLCMEVHRITTYSDKMYCLHAWQMIHFLVISDNINGTWRTSQNSTLHITAWSMRRFMPIWHYLCQRRSIKRAVPMLLAQNSLYAYFLEITFCVIVEPLS